MFLVPVGCLVGGNGPVRINANPIPGGRDGDERSYSKEVPHGFTIVGEDANE